MRVSPSPSTWPDVLAIPPDAGWGFCRASMESQSADPAQVFLCSKVQRARVSWVRDPPILWPASSTVLMKSGMVLARRDLQDQYMSRLSARTRKLTVLSLL